MIYRVLMVRESSASNHLEITAAKEAFSPERFGFDKHGRGWKRHITGVGTTVFAPLSWEHAHLLTNLGNDVESNSLELASHQQKIVFGIKDDRDVIPPYLLSNIERTGGSVFVAYKEKDGFTSDGWLGFGFVLGGKSHSLESIFLGVRDLHRSTSIGFNLRLLQAHTALEQGYTNIEWQQGPLRGEIAKLSIDKLGGVASQFTIDKYKDMEYKLYGPGTTDRITILWDLLSSRVHNRINAVYEGSHQGLSIDDVSNLPTVDSSNVNQAVTDKHQQLLYEIPTNADKLDEGKKLIWRNDMRIVFQALMDTESADVPTEATNDPALVKKIETYGDYRIEGFITGPDGNIPRRNFYLLKRKLGR